MLIETVDIHKCLSTPSKSCTAALALTSDTGASFRTAQTALILAFMSMSDPSAGA